MSIVSFKMSEFPSKTNFERETNFSSASYFDQTLLMNLKLFANLLCSLVRLTPPWSLERAIGKR